MELRRILSSLSSVWRNKPARRVIFFVVALLACLVVITWAPSLLYPVLQSVLGLALGYMGVEMANNPPKDAHKNWWRAGFLAIAFLLLAVTWYQAKDQSNKEEQTTQIQIRNGHTLASLTNEIAALQKKQNERDNRIAALLKDQSEGYKSFGAIFSTNATIDPVIRLAVLKTEQAKAIQEIEDRKELRELLPPTVLDLTTARQERDFDLAIQEGEKRKEFIAEQIKAIEAEQERKEKQRIADEQKRMTEEQRRVLKERDEKIELFMTDAILPVFDYTIRTLDKTLEGIAAGCGEKRLSDFPGTSPTAYGASFLKNQRLVPGTNVVCLGTNPAWRFEIFTSIHPLPERKQPNRRLAGFSEPLASINILSKTTSGQSSLEITPSVGRRGPVVWDATNIVVRGVSIKLKVPNGLNFNEGARFTNYSASVDKAIRRLIAAQDQQCPIDTKAQ